MAMSVDLPMPEAFDYCADKWTGWKKRFQRFRIASDLANKSDERQISTLVYCMGGERAEDILSSFNLTNEETASFDTVLERFDKHFVVRTNVIFERAQFNCRRQEPGETTNDFITALYKLVATCNYGDKRDELLRDRIVVGIADKQLSEKLQRDGKLTLEKAVTQVRQAEQIHQQQRQLNAPDQQQAVNAISSNQAGPGHTTKFSSAHQKGKGQQGQQQPSCPWCGKHRHDRRQCPARDVDCRKCGKHGHFDKVCKSSTDKAMHAVEDDIDSLLLGSVDALTGKDLWLVKLQVIGKQMEFRIDTGAEADKLDNSISLMPTDKVLRAANRSHLQVAGTFKATLRWNDKQITEVVYVLHDLHKPLLGRGAFEALGLVTRICVINDGENIKQQYSDLFTGLGCMSGEHTIRLKPDAKPFAIFTPRHVAVNLMLQLRQHLDQLLRMRVIRRVDEPTPWYAGIVVLPKKTSGIRMCVDLTRLNDSVLREQYTLPAIDQMLARMTGAKLFSKLDCNSGFYQMPLSPESQLLTTFTTPFGRFCYQRLPFGHCSASEVYQRKICDLIDGLDGVLCLIDDVLIFGETKAQHDARLHEVLQRFRQANITLNDKCEFAKQRIKFAGHIISAEGISPDPDKLSAIVNMQPPTNLTELRCFLGMVNQLAKFASNLAENTAPLRKLLRKDREWTWDVPRYSKQHLTALSKL
jgi:predicted aspartyl protease